MFILHDIKNCKSFRFEIDSESYDADYRPMRSKHIWIGICGSLLGFLKFITRKFSDSEKFNRKLFDNFLFFVYFLPVSTYLIFYDWTRKLHLKDEIGKIGSCWMERYQACCIQCRLILSWHFGESRRNICFCATKKVTRWSFLTSYFNIVFFWKNILLFCFIWRAVIKFQRYEKQQRKH